jgi:hypothetical protein
LILKPPQFLWGGVGWGGFQTTLNLSVGGT